MLDLGFESVVTVSVLEKTKRKSMSSEVITLDVTLCFGCNRVFEFTSVI